MDEAQQVLNKLMGKLESWGDQAVLLLPNFAVAVLVLVTAWLLAKLTRVATYRLLGHVSRIDQVNRVVAGSLYVVVLAAGLFVALGVLGLDKTVTSLLAGAGIIGLALAFAFQDIATNFMAGIFMSVQRPFLLGELVETKDYFGTVQRISLRWTELLTPEGQFVLIPNKEVFENPIVNYSRTGERRVDLPVGISYGEDLEHVKRVTLAAVERVSCRKQGRDIDFFFDGFGDSSINFVVRMWVDFAKQKDYFVARGEMIERIKAAYNEAGITIPFPIRTLDFGIVGGQRLADNLRALPPFAGGPR
jgi:small-conductance mechanosensitive channel